ncbi:SAM-dependent methyltransferase [Rhodoferax ferrireducens]|uniref:SAM-dependent methyltransferase n=1 Tax=Rhodoferax ferrireducens TaxID=192843 RepID=UPI000E0D4FEC|nr:class I SAM-dependent methyltransferase [Rhodoferax ferrireducens]
MKDTATPGSSGVEAFEEPIYASVASRQAQVVLDLHYDIGGGLYKMWASPRSVWRAIILGWERSGHPAQLHYGWDLEHAVSLDEAIHETTLKAVNLLQLDHVASPRIFEPGCGIGGAVTTVAQRLPNATVVGMSLVASQINAARSRASAIGLGNTEFHVGNYLATPFETASMDGIYGIEALCYTPETERLALFAELYRILKPGGHLVVLDGVSLRAARNEEERVYIADVLAGWTMPMPCSVSDFAEFARIAGFSVLSQEDITAHVIGSARRIKNIARYLLQPLAFLARLPGLSNLLRPLGFGSALHARRFVNACLSQQQVFDHGLGAYYVHLLCKPPDAAAH